ncbi:PH domain-containing protein [Geoglobus ahangari]
MSEVPQEVLEVLDPGEEVLYCVKKKLKTELKPKFLAVTNRRVIYLDQKILGRYDIQAVPYEKLEVAYYRKGKIGAEFILHSEEGDELKLSWMDKSEAQDAIVAIRDALNAIAVEPVTIKKKKGLIGEEWEIRKPKELVTKSVQVATPVATSASASEDPIEQLKKLKELFDAGIITAEEYEEKKQKLLEKI